MKVKRALVLELNKLTEDQEIILDELSRRRSNFFKFLENPKKDKSKGIEVVRPPKYANPEIPHRAVIWFDLVIGLKGGVRVRIYKFSKGISESLLFAGIGVSGSVNLPRGIRVGLAYQTPSKVYDFSRR